MGIRNNAQESGLLLADWGEAIVGSVILVCFAAGALLGGACTLRLRAYPLLPAVVLAAAGTLLTMRERERRLN